MHVVGYEHGKYLNFGVNLYAMSCQHMDEAGITGHYCWKSVAARVCNFNRVFIHSLDWNIKCLLRNSFIFLPNKNAILNS
jgi:hypothetical protein